MIKTLIKLPLIILFFFSNIIVSQTDAGTFQNKQKFSILFVGNSLTYSNDLPNIVKLIAKQKGIILTTKMIAFANYSIEDHWKDGEVQNQLNKKTYDFVIIQQGPSSQANGKKMLINYGKKYTELCKINNVKLCYFMVWPSINYYHTFKGVINNYREAAIKNNAIICPVGERWKTYFDTTNNFDYYSVDGFHPSVKGSQVAAEIIVLSLFSNND